MAIVAGILTRASELVVAFLFQHCNAAHQEARLSVESVVFRPAKNLQHGDIFASKEVGTAVEQIVQKEAGLKIEDILKRQNTPPSADECIYFRKVTLNPQGQLCLSLHWPLVFAEGLQEVTRLGVKYGITTDKVLEPVVVVSSIHQGTLQPSQSACKAATQGTVLDQSILASLSIAEGRTLMLAGLLSNLLKIVGHPVKHLATFESYQVPSPDDPVFSVGHLLKTFSTDSEPPPGQNAATLEHFLSSLRRYLISPDGEFSGLTTAELAKPAATLCVPEAIVDAKKFLKDTALSGKGGYDRNIHRIQITDTSGTVTPMGMLAFEVYRVVNSQEDHKVIHVAQQQKSFAVQQAMVVTDILSEKKAVPFNQHLLVVSGVDCLVDGNPTEARTLAELMKARLGQMTEAYIIKYGEKAKGPHLQEIALRMAEAVVKFELLSTDPKATVKIKLPSMGAEADIRFSGAFVLYNYARLATLFINFGKACERGIYPPLPGAKEIDFSLLSDKEEWQLLFHYVMQYPLLIREAAELKRTGIGIHLEIGLKQVCLFLTKLSHAFSSYYSRVKVLMTPEPHLFPLIHARLYLMAAVKQVMHNALAVLAIEPLEQL